MHTPPSPPTPAHPVSEAAPSPLAVGLVGTGGIARAHAPGWARLGVNLHVFSESGAADFASEHAHLFPSASGAGPGITVHDSLESLLAHVSAVDICTPTPSHPRVVNEALAAGLDILCEKPLALTEEEARQMADAASAAGKVLFPAHVVRFFPQYEALKAAADAGRLGTVATLRFERTGSMPEQPWFGNDAQSGGIVMDQMIHDLDQALWLAGPATSVYATRGGVASAPNVRAAHVTLEHASGAISHCQGLWGPPGTEFHYSFDVAGSEGRLAYDSGLNTGIEFDAVASGARGASYLPSVAGMKDPYAAEIEEFWAALHAAPEARVMRVSAEDAVTVAKVANAARESMRTGERISL